VTSTDHVKIKEKHITINCTLEITLHNQVRELLTNKNTYLLTNINRKQLISLRPYFQIQKYINFIHYFQRGDLRFSIVVNSVVKNFKTTNEFFQNQLMDIGKVGGYLAFALD
jgi:hypothetical protein